MRNFLLFFLLLLIFLGCSSKKSRHPDRFVFDHEKIFNDEQVLKLNELFKNHEKKTGNEIVLVTTENFGEDKNALTFSTNFGNLHGVGKKGIDNGIVIGLSKKLKDVGIATGSEMEGVLTDQDVKWVIDNIMIPQFKRGSYFDGLYEGSSKIIWFLEKPENEIK